MKELYISPDAEILCFMPVERLAYGQFNVYNNGEEGEVADSTFTTPDEETEPKD